MKETSDPGGQLAWLETELTKIETEKRVVWITGNVAPTSKYCNSNWSKRYNVLVERFQDIIRMQIFGHEVEDYFAITSEPIKGNKYPMSL